MKSNKPLIIIASISLIAVMSVTAICIFNWNFRHEKDFFGLSLGMSMNEVNDVLADDMREVTFSEGIDSGIDKDLPPLFPNVKSYLIADDFPVLTYRGRLILMFDENDCLYGAVYYPQNYECTPQCGNVIYDYFSRLYGKPGIYGGSEIVRTWEKGTKIVFYYENMQMEFTIQPDEYLVAVFKNDRDLFFILCDGMNLRGDYTEWIKVMSDAAV